MPKFDWSKRCSYDVVQKRAFHREASKVLRSLARELGFERGSFDLRSNLAGIAVSGEITLHHENIYIQVSQSATGSDKGVLIRTCEGRKDYSGGPNNLMAYNVLDDIRAFADKVRKIQPMFDMGEEEPKPAL